MIVETPLHPVKLDKVCDNCQKGLISCVGENSGKYIHRCPECNFSELHDIQYPNMIFKETKQ